MIKSRTKNSEDQRGQSNRGSDERGSFRDQCGARVQDDGRKANQIRMSKLTGINAKRFSHEKCGLEIRRK